MKAGITGHQNIGSLENIEWVSKTLLEIIQKFGIQMGFTCLAIGTDQLFANILKEKNLPYIAIIPSNRYENTFLEKKHLKMYKKLLNNAFEIIKLDFNRPKEIAFFEGGKKVVDLSDIIIAVWNGKKAKGLGGTADIVKYAVSKKKSVIHVNPITKKISKM